jgi:protein-disulfide isomerase
MEALTVSKRVDRKQAARFVREQLAKERRQRRMVAISVVAGAIVIVAALVGLVVSQSQKPNTGTAPPAGVTSDGGDNGAVRVAGEGPVKVEVYLDFLCPVCRQFESDTGPTIDQLLTDKKITLIWHPIAILDDRSTSSYSTRAASAAGCASDAGKLKGYGTALFANQPEEGSAGLSDDKLIDVGTKIGLTAPSFAQCVRDQKYAGWVAHVTDLAGRHNVNSTPTIFVNGKELTDRSANGLKAAVAAAGRVAS